MKKTSNRLHSLFAALAALILAAALAVPAFAVEGGFADLYYRMFDDAEVLTEDEDNELEDALEELSLRQSFDVTIATMGKVARIAANFSEYIANEPKVSYRDGRYFVFDGQNTIEARKTCNGGRDLPIRCKVFYGHSKEHEALLFAVQTGISSELTAGEQLRAKLVAHEENACDFAAVTENTGVRFALDGIRAPWKIYCIRSAYYIYKSYGAALYREMLSILVDVWDGDSDSFLSGILHGMARFLALYQGEYSRERLVGRLRTVHPKTITRLAQNGIGNVADRHMKQILSIYNGAGRAHSLPCKR